MEPKRILIADREDVANSIKYHLLKDLEGITCEIVNFSQIDRITGNYDLVITDIRMPNLDGKDFLKRVKIIDKDAIIIVLTGYGSIPSAVELIKLGAYDYLEKPINFEELEMSLNRALEKKQIENQLNFFKGMLLTIIISIPLWLILGIILALLWE